jgi:acetyl esterase
MAELHPDAAAFLEQAETVPSVPTHGLTPAGARRSLRDLLVDEEPYEPVGAVDEFELPGPDGPVAVRLYTPEAAGPHPVLVFVHGGGWVRGDLDTHDNVCRALCARAGCAVLSVDYRRAPEHPFPAALEDCYAALEWTAEHAGRLTLDPDRIAVGGDSAGGNLSAGLALMARDRDGPALARQLLIYPAVASPELQSFDSYEENAFGYLLERPGIEWYYERYAPSPAQARNEYLAPLLASDLSGLPPATVVTAGFDPLRDEGIEYADRLAADGVDVEHRHYEGMIHAFVSLPEAMSAGDEALSAMAGDLRAAFE